MENHEILKNLISLYKDTEYVLNLFINDNIINNYKLSKNNLYLNDNILIIKKNDLNFICIGTIIHINKKGDTVCLKKRGNKSSYNFNVFDYYIFIKNKSKNNDRQFYENLLNLI